MDNVYINDVEYDMEYFNISKDEYYDSMNGKEIRIYYLPNSNEYDMGHLSFPYEEYYESLIGKQIKVYHLPHSKLVMDWEYADAGEFIKY